MAFHKHIDFVHMQHRGYHAVTSVTKYSLPHPQEICFSYHSLHLEHLMSSLAVPWQSEQCLFLKGLKKLPFHFNSDGNKQYLYLMSLIRLDISYQ